MRKPYLLWTGLVIMMASWLAGPGLAQVEPPAGQLVKSQWLTGPRLIKLGESIDFRLYLPEGVAPGELVVFPRYLEQSSSRAEGFKDDGNLDWLEALPHQAMLLEFEGGRASITYTPKEPGNYLARWAVGGEQLYRYFAVVTDEYVVVRYTTGGDWRPNYHATGIAIEYRLEANRFSADDPECVLISDYQRRFGDGVVPLLQDTPDLSAEERLSMLQSQSKRPDRLFARDRNHK